MQLSKNVGRGITYVFIVIFVVAAAQVAVGSALGSTPVYVVVSGSMIPTLDIGDLVVTQNVPYSHIHVGDVIIYDKPNLGGGCGTLTIVHRVVSITSQGLQTQGDDRRTNPLPDEPYEWPYVPPSCVKGVVVLAVPYLGLISMLIPYPWNYVLVGLVLLLVFLAELRPSGEGSEGGVEEETEEGRGPSEGGQAPEAPSQSHDTFLRSRGIARTTC